jgi:hypothetical protein
VDASAFATELRLGKNGRGSDEERFKKSLLQWQRWILYELAVVQSWRAKYANNQETKESNIEYREQNFNGRVALCVNRLFSCIGLLVLRKKLGHRHMVRSSLWGIVKGKLVLQAP